MDKKTKLFFFIFFLALATSIGATYYRIVVARDYVILAQADCDPTTENCFVYECDPEAEECSGIPEEDIWYYEKVSRKAANIPLCNPDEEDCEALVCPEGEEECEVAFCDEATKTDDETCSDPEIYNAENPVEDVSADEEEEAYCEEGDEECLGAESEDVSAEETEEAACEEGDETCGADEGDNPDLSAEETEVTGNDTGLGGVEEKESPTAVDTENSSAQKGGFPLE